MEDNQKHLKGTIVIVIAILLFGVAFGLWAIYNKNEEQTNSKPRNDYPQKLETPQVLGVEKYKIISAVMLPIPGKKDEFEPGFILHLDDGRVRVINVQQAARDNDLLNINEGYLYRINGQFYLKKN